MGSRGERTRRGRTVPLLPCCRRPINNRLPGALPIALAAILTSLRTGRFVPGGVDDSAADLAFGVLAADAVGFLLGYFCPTPRKGIISVERRDPLSATIDS